MANPVAQLITQYARKHGVDPRAALAVARGEGGLKWGAVGDQGTSYGPFQLHRGGALPKNRNAAWANSAAGVEYAIAQMAKSGARGLTGRAAVDAIVRGFERPADPDTSVANAWKRYGSSTVSPPSRSVGGTLPPTLKGGFGAPPDMTSTILGNLGGIASGDWDPVESMESLVEAALAPRAKPGPVGGADPVDPRGHKVSQAVTALDPGGGWGGAYQPASALAAIGRQHGLQSTSEKRDRKTTASGGTSDHWAGSKSAYAYDLGGSVKDMDRGARAIAQRLGIPYKGGPLVATVNRGGLRYQVLYRTNVGGNHFDHIHVGVRRA